MTLTRC